MWGSLFLASPDDRLNPGLAFADTPETQRLKELVEGENLHSQWGVFKKLQERGSEGRGDRHDADRVPAGHQVAHSRAFVARLSGGLFRVTPMEPFARSPGASSKGGRGSH